MKQVLLPAQISLPMVANICHKKKYSEREIREDFPAPALFGGKPRLRYFCLSAVEVSVRLSALMEDDGLVVHLMHGNTHRA
jgi:hypothetical protein